MSRIHGLSSALAFAAALAAPIAFAQGPPDGDGGITQTVARVSYLDGDVSYARGDDPDNWQPADRNVPMTLGDRVYTGGNSRVELELNGGDVVRLAPGSDLTALNLTEDTRQFALKSGIAFFRVPDLESNELFEVDSPNAAVTFERSGEYRIDVDADGNTRVSVHKGSATIAAGGGQVSVGADAGIRIDGLDAPRYEVIGLPAVDEWDRWAGERDSRALRSQSHQYVSAGVSGVEDLDEYGHWQQVPEYGWAWSPTSVNAGWAPYRAGRWLWQQPWGWTWVSTEPWGWAPYHSGRWVFAASRWCWIPVAPSIRVVHYAPALVAFVGGGPGFSVAAAGGGFVGWFPLAPRDPLVPWWGRRGAVAVTQVTNVTYVNRTYVTVVNQNTFVSGRPVSAGLITERTVVRQAAEAPVLRGPMPVAPTVASTRISVRPEASASRPPAAIAGRPVVARAAPPPAPQRFDAKLAMSRQGAAEPASTHTAADSRAATALRPAVNADGKVTLSRRTSSSNTSPQRVEPIAPPKGRPLATEASPVARSSGPASVPRAEPPSQVAQGRVERPPTEARKPPPASVPPDARPAHESRAQESTRPQSAAPTPRVVEPQRNAARSVPRAVSPAPEHGHAVPTPAARPAQESAQHRPASGPAPTHEAHPKEKPNGKSSGQPHPAPRPTHPPEPRNDPS